MCIVWSQTSQQRGSGPENFRAGFITPELSAAPTDRFVRAPRVDAEEELVDFTRRGSEWCHGMLPGPSLRCTLSEPPPVVSSCRLESRSPAQTRLDRHDSELLQQALDIGLWAWKDH